MLKFENHWCNIWLSMHFNVRDTILHSPTLHSTGKDFFFLSLVVSDQSAMMHQNDPWSLFKIPMPRSHIRFTESESQVWEPLIMPSVQNGEKPQLEPTATNLKEECSSWSCELWRNQSYLWTWLYLDCYLLGTGREGFSIVCSWVMFVATLDADKSKMSVFWGASPLSPRLYFHP